MSHLFFVTLGIKLCRNAMSKIMKNDFIDKTARHFFNYIKG